MQVRDNFVTLHLLNLLNKFKDFMNRFLLLASISLFFMAITITNVVAQEKPNTRWDYKPYYGTNRTSPFTQGGIITPKGEEIAHMMKCTTDAWLPMPIIGVGT